MRWSRDRPAQVTLLAFALAAAAVIAIAGAYGFSAFGAVWSHLHPGWLLLADGAELLTVPAYVVAYRWVASIDGGPRLSLALVTRVVMAGFGPFVLAGGFAVDKRALHAIENDEHSATVRVLGLGALEWALLAPAAWLAAVVLLIAGDTRPWPSLLWPWAIAVPVGFALGFWLAAPARCRRIASGDARWRRVLSTGLRGVGVLRALARERRTHWPAWVGSALYWSLDIASFYGALRVVGLTPNLGEVVLGFATGYALTRRSLPLGGAGITEALMTFAMHWVGQPILASLAAVVIYRVFNFALPTVPALLVRPRVKPLIDAADEERPLARRERERAAAPIGI